MNAVYMFVLYVKKKKCGKSWDTMRGWVAFWIWQNQPVSGGKRQGGKVTIDILRQGCKSKQCTDESSETPEVLFNLLSVVSINDNDDKFR